MKKQLKDFTPDANVSDLERMSGLVEALSAYIEQYHGGYVELISFDGKEVVVEMGGACVGCPYSLRTLNDWIANNVLQFFPGVEKVTALEPAEGE